MEPSAAEQVGEQPGPSRPPLGMAPQPPGAALARSGAPAEPAPAPAQRAPSGAGAPTVQHEQALHNGKRGPAEPAAAAPVLPAATPAAGRAEVAAVSRTAPGAAAAAGSTAPAALAAKAQPAIPSGSTSGAQAAVPAAPGARPSLLASLPLQLGIRPFALPLPWSGPVLLPVPGLLIRPGPAPTPAAGACLPGPRSETAPENGGRATLPAQQQPTAAPAPKQAAQAATPQHQHAVGSKRSAEAALKAPAPALPPAGAGLALGIPILPHPAAVAAREAAAAAAVPPARAPPPGLVVGLPMDASSGPPAAPTPPARPTPMPTPAPAVTATVPAAQAPPLFQPTPSLAAVAAAAAAAADGSAGSGDEEEARPAEDEGRGGMGGGGAWAGAAPGEALAGEGQPPNKKSRLVWTQELHNRFINALSHLGLKNAVPKSILAMMNVEGMTRENVASHLQKYRLHLRRLGGFSERDRLEGDALQRLHEQNVQQMAAQQVLQYSLAVMHGPPAPPPAAPGLPAPGIALPPLASHPPAQLSAEPVTGIPLMPGSPPSTLPCGPLAAVAAAAAAAAAAEARRNGSGAAAALSSRPPLPVPSGAQHKAHLPPPNKGLAMRSLQGMQRLQPGLALEQQHQQLQQTPPKLPLEAKAAPAGGHLAAQMHQQPPALSGAAHGPVAAMAVKQGDLEHDGRASGPAVAAAAAGINGAASGSRPAASGIATAAGQSLPRLMVRTDPAKERKPPGSGAADAPATPTDRSAC